MREYYLECDAREELSAWLRAIADAQRGMAELRQRRRSLVRGGLLTLKRDGRDDGCCGGVDSQLRVDG
jgi:hypothetical protein